MKLQTLTRALALATAIATPALASAADFTVDFEQNWDYGALVDTTYATQGITFSDAIFGLSNGDGLGGNADGSYYSGAPSPLGVMYAFSFEGAAATMAVTGGHTGTLHFAYASSEAVVGGVKAYDVNGTLLGSLDLASTGGYNAWNQVAFSFTGTAATFDFTAASGYAAFDNISSVPEPTSLALLLAGAGLVLGAARRRG